MAFGDAINYGEKKGAVETRLASSRTTKRFFRTLAIMSLILFSLTLISSSTSVCDEGNLQCRSSLSPMFIKRRMSTGDYGESLNDLTLNGGWKLFTFSNPHELSGTAMFSSDMCVAMRVTDAFLVGDQFEVFDNSISQGITSQPLPDAPDSGTDVTDPFMTFDDPRFSSRFYKLCPGSHVITIAPILSPFGGGEAFARIDEVPCCPEDEYVPPYLSL